MSGNIKKISNFLRKKRRYLLTVISINRLSIGFAILFSIYSTLALLFSFSSILALINLIYLVSIITLPIIFLWGVVIPIKKNFNLKKIAKKLELENSEKHNYLISSFELSKDTTYKNSELTNQVIQRAADSLEQFKNLLKPKIKLLNILFFVISFSSVYFSAKYLSPSVKDWILYPINKNQISIKSSVSSHKIPQNGRVTLKCITEVNNKNEIKLTIYDLLNSKKESEVFLRESDSGIFQYTIDSIQSSFQFEFSYGPLTSEIETVIVIPPPQIYSLNINVRAPYYTSKGAVDQDEGIGDITACYGSEATFKIQATEPLKSCTFIKGEKDSIPFEISDGLASGKLRLYSNTSYSFLLEDSLNQKSDSTAKYFINIIPDLPPTVSITKPGRDKILEEAQRETLNVELYDDYGIKSLQLGYRKTSINDPETYYNPIKLKNKHLNSFGVTIPMNISELSLYPGDSLYYWVQVLDNKPFGKPNISISDTFFFRLPTYSEIHKMIADREKGAENALKSVKDMQDQIDKNLEDLKSSAQDKKNLSWEDKQLMKDLQKQMNEQKDSLSSAIDAMKEAVDKLKESGTTEKISEKMKEVQKELEKLLEELGDSLLLKNDPLKKPPSISDLKKSLEKMAENLPNLEKRLENTIKYLKMLQKESERAILADRAEKLAEEQFKISENLKGEELSKRESDLQKKVDDLLKDTKKSLDDENSPIKSDDLSSLSDVQKSSENVQSEMNKNQTPSKSSMNQMSASLSGMSSELKSTLSSAMMEAARKDQENLMKMAQNSLSMTEWQQNLKDIVGKKHESKEKIAQAQQALKDALSNSTLQLNELSMVPPTTLADLYSSMQKGSQSMKKAMNTIHSPQTGFHMNKAMESLNELTNKLLSAADGMNQQNSGGSGGAGGLQQALQQLSGQQASINAATQQLLQSMLEGSKPGMKPGNGQKQQGNSQSGDGENSGLSGNAKKSVEKAQKALADKLKELSDRHGDSKDGNLKSRVEELEKEARRITQLFKNPNQEISEKQDLLLKRMLNAVISLNRKDEGKEERKSTSSKTHYSEFINEKIDYRNIDIDNFYKLRSKALSGKYPISYRQKINNYFDRLQKHLMTDKE